MIDWQNHVVSKFLLKMVGEMQMSRFWCPVVIDPACAAFMMFKSNPVTS